MAYHGKLYSHKKNELDFYQLIWGNLQNVLIEEMARHREAHISVF